MKCNECLSCMKKIRIDTEEESEIFCYCPLCDIVYKFPTREIVDNVLVKEKYYELFGRRIA